MLDSDASGDLPSLILGPKSFFSLCIKKVNIFINNYHTYNISISGIRLLQQKMEAKLISAFLQTVCRQTFFVTEN